MNNENHWARNRDSSEFTPLGQFKLELLALFISDQEWFRGEERVNNTKFICDVRSDRCFASQMYIICKDEIERMCLRNPHIELLARTMADQAEEWRIKNKAANKLKKQKKPKAKAKAKKKSLPDNVISFEEFKKKRAG